VLDEAAAAIGKVSEEAMKKIRIAGHPSDKMV